MAQQGLTSPVDVAAWAKQTVKDEYQAALQSAIDAAGSMLETLTNRVLIRATKTVYFDGKRALGNSDELWLDPGHRPVLHTGSDLVTVSVNGSSLTVAASYSTTAGVMLVGANEDSPCRLIRQFGPWTTGIRNIVVSYKCGFQTDPALTATDTFPVPSNIKQLANEMSWLVFNSASLLGKQNVSHAVAAVTLSNELSPYGKAVLEAITVLAA